MGHKVNPVGFRVGINRNWDSRWFVGEKTKYGDFILEDIKIRKYFNSKLNKAIVSHIEIERKKNSDGVYKVLAKVFVADFGIISKTVDEVKEDFHHKFVNADFEIVEVRQSRLDASIVAKMIVKELEKRISYKKVMQKFTKFIRDAGARGCRICISGRLNGVDIARSEDCKSGTIPLHTIRSDIDFAVSEAKTTYGNLGIKVWICC